jgi:hypothetical protein
MAYTGGSRIATGSTQAVRKSRTRPLSRYATRGVTTTETAPQLSSSKNRTRSPGRQEVADAATATSARAATGTAPI